MQRPEQKSARSNEQSVIIIGGGIVAIASAHYLNQAGFRVTVIEQNEIASACSHGNCGYICPSHVLPLTTPEAIPDAIYSILNPTAAFRVKFRFDKAFAYWMWQFSKRCTQQKMLEAARHLKAVLDSSSHEYQKLLSDDQMECGWQQRGLLYVLQTSVGMSNFEKTDYLLSENFDVKAERIEGSALHDFEPALRPEVAGAFHYRADSNLRPDRLAKVWTEKLARAGVQFIENCAFEKLDRNRAGIDQIYTSLGTMKADHYILATGAISTKLASHFGSKIPIEPGKGYSITMDRPEHCPKHPILLPEHHVGITPFDDGFRLGSMMEFTGYDRSLPKARLQQLRDSAKPYLRSTLPSANLEEWYGWRPMTWDSLPIIGQIPGIENAYLATGHNMLGLTLAPATGKLLSEIIQRQTPHIDPEPFSPARFN